VKTSDFDYLLPAELIAQHPLERRDASRLLVLDRSNGAVEHRRFYELPDMLKQGDLMVFNTSKVFPARVFGKRPSGAAVEALILTIKEDGTCGALVRHGRKLKPGEIVSFENGVLKLRYVERRGEEFIFKPESAKSLMDVLFEIGHVPLPPYIERKDAPDDRTRYQTVYADVVGAVAAPTAGLHFAKETLDALDGKGIERCEAVLHVGYGTFKPLKIEDLSQHKMHSERFSVSPAALGRISKQLEHGRRIVAVGTTTCRLLESLGLFLDGARNLKGSISTAIQDGVAERKDVKIRLDLDGGITGETAIFIYPGFDFKLTGALVTNFHLPKSTLLMLVSAFAGKKFVLDAYRDAVERKYRFYSYGDAMFIK
jgi:S-adenosylmethionine:tRNA ribosyltransferase-isomerase